MASVKRALPIPASPTTATMAAIDREDEGGAAFSNASSASRPTRAVAGGSF
jgi:hypothetical protein